MNATLGSTNFVDVSRLLSWKDKIVVARQLLKNSSYSLLSRLRISPSLVYGAKPSLEPRYKDIFALKDFRITRAYG